MHQYIDPEFYGQLSNRVDEADHETVPSVSDSVSLPHEATHAPRKKAYGKIRVHVKDVGSVSVSCHTLKTAIPMRPSSISEINTLVNKGSSRAAE